MKKLILSLTLVCLLIPLGIQADEQRPVVQPLREAFIKYDRLSWQTFEFWALTNLPKEYHLKYEWNIDNIETYNTNSVRAFLPRGEHIVKLKIEDKYGNVKYDTVRLNIHFWSLQNNWFWWLVYFIVVLIILYYWIVKLLYLFNRRKFSKDVREFMDVLDSHGWIEEVIANHTKADKKPKKK
jgi:hypothetical protein